MREVALAHEVVGSERFVNIAVVDAHGDPHEHVLRAFNDLPVQLEQVGTLDGLETEVIVVVIATVVDMAVQSVSVGHDDFVNFLGDERGMFVGFRVDILPQIGDNVGKHILCRAV